MPPQILRRGRASTLPAQVVTAGAPSLALRHSLKLTCTQGAPEGSDKTEEAPEVGHTDGGVEREGGPFSVSATKTVVALRGWAGRSEDRLP